MIEGRVRRLIYNAREDVDGWELEGGELIHFPPHIGEQLGAPCAPLGGADTGERD